MSSHSTTVIRPSKEHLLGAAIMFLICLMFTGYNIAWFFWVPLVPLVFVIWILRVRTIVSDKGISTRYLFRQSQSVTWDNFSGVLIAKNARGYAVRTDDSKFWLPGITFNSLIELSKASNGRIPDPVTAGREATHDKVQVVHKDGYAVLMDKDEYAEYEAARRAEYAEQHGTKEAEQQPTSTLSSDADDHSTTQDK